MKAIFLAFIVFHLGITLLGITHLNDIIRQNSKLHYLHAVYNYYNKITFSGQRFTFFGRNSEKQYSSTIICTDSTGREFRYIFPDTNPEVSLRTKQMASQFKKPGYSEALADSWGNNIFLHHPEVIKIRIQILEHSIAGLKDYKKGEKFASTTLYETTVRR
jgi:hypothetical protein